MSSALQILVVDDEPAIRQILAASASEWEGAEAPELRSPLQAFLKQINKVEPCTLTQLHELVKKPGKGW